MDNTLPTKRVSSPAGTSAETRPVSQPIAPATNGGPSPARTSMPTQSAIGGTPRAKCCAPASRPAARRLTPNAPGRRSSSWSAASRRTAKPTSGGSSESGIKVPTVSPTRSPSRSTPTIATPAGNRRISPRSSCPPTTAARLLIPARRVWRNTVCSPGPRCSPPGTVLSRAHIYGYGRSLRPPQGTSIAPRRRAVFRQTLLELEQGPRGAGSHQVLARLEHDDIDWAVARRDGGVRPRGFVGLVVQFDAEKSKLLTDGCADGRRVLTDAGGEHERFEAAERRRHRAHGRRYAIGEDGESEARGGGVRAFQLPQVSGQTGKAGAAGVRLAQAVERIERQVVLQQVKECAWVDRAGPGRHRHALERGEAHRRVD